ncbi:hypothetical protein JCM11251_005789 [Rhodosporidiobolus azoricus]
MSTARLSDPGARPAASGYNGSHVSRFTSNDLRPIESLAGQGGRDEQLQDRDASSDEEHAQGARQQEKQGEDIVVGEGAGGKGEVIAEEWTFPDGGWKAWGVILGCWLYSCNVQGYGMIWGAIVTDLQRNHHPNVALSSLQFIVGLQNFGLNASPFITGRLGEIYGFKRMIAIGSVSAIVCLVIAACTVDYLPCLFIFQGILLGIAHGISLPLFMTLPSQWFSKRRGLATGIVVSGTGFGGGTASLILRGILPSIGYRNSLLVYAAISALIYAGGWFLLKTRKPPKTATPARYDTKTGLPPGIWKDPAFWCLCMSVFFGVFGFLTPSYYLTAYTQAMVPSLNPDSLAPAVPLIVSNFTLGIGRIFAGSLADYLGPTNCMIFTWAAGGILQMAWWSNAKSYGSIIAFSAVCYSLGAWFFLLMPAVAAQLFGIRGLATITGYIITGQSPGQLAGASVSGAIQEKTGEYKYLCYYAGACMMCGALWMLPARFLRERRLFARF